MIDKTVYGIYREEIGDAVRICGRLGRGVGGVAQAEGVGRRGGDGREVADLAEVLVPP